jgi:hypothetical protein
MKKNPDLIAWLDVDDVLVEFTRPFNVLHGLPSDYMPDKRGYGLHNIGRPMDQALSDLTGSFVENQPPYPGGPELTRWLKRQGVPVVLITAIPSKDCPERLINMVNNKIHFDHILFTKGRSKGDFANALIKKIAPNGDPHSIFIDDMAHAVFDFVSRVRKSFGATLDIPFTADHIKNRDNVDLINNGVVKIVPDQAGMFQFVKDTVKSIRNLEVRHGE